MIDRTSHPFTQPDDHVLFRPEASSEREATIQVAAVALDPADFMDLMEHLALPCTYESLATIDLTVAARTKLRRCS